MLFAGQSGERIVYRPTGDSFNVAPLGFPELVSGIGSERPLLNIVFSDVEIRENSVGPVPSHPVTIRKSITHRGRVEVFGLVPGGWLPLPWAHKQVAWVDRNIVRSLAKALVSGVRLPWAHEGAGLGQDVHRVSSVLYALEGGLQRKPTFDEMNASLDEGSKILGAVLPDWQVEGHSEFMRRALFQELERLHEISTRSKELLIFSAPLIAQPVSRTKQRFVEGQILKVAKATKTSILVVLALLSCLYDNSVNAPNHRAGKPGRMVLKPGGLTTDAGLYNALSDLAHVELLLGAVAVLPSYRPVLYTRDIGLAAFWAVLSPSNPSVAPGSSEGLVRPRWDFQLSPSMFPALSSKECADLGGRLKDLW